MLGWLCCVHKNDDEQIDEFWHTVNPELDDTISSTTFMTFINYMFDIAITVRHSIEEGKAHKDPQIWEYLEKLTEARDAGFKAVLEGNEKDTYSKEDVQKILNKDYFTTYAIRAKVLPSMALA